MNEKRKPIRETLIEQMRLMLPPPKPLIVDYVEKSGLVCMSKDTLEFVKALYAANEKDEADAVFCKMVKTWVEK